MGGEGGRGVVWGNDSAVLGGDKLVLDGFIKDKTIRIPKGVSGKYLHTYLHTLHTYIHIYTYLPNAWICISTMQEGICRRLVYNLYI